MGDQLLTFISNEDLYRHVRVVLDAARNASKKAETEFHRNVVDPFSALFDGLYQHLDHNSWIKQEKARQAQKTLQNAIGDFHEGILGSIPGWEKLPTGNVVDLHCKSKKVIAEVKNKFNTTKGNHKVRIYDDLNTLLTEKYQGYTSYYVEIIPKGRKKYDQLFTPSDNQVGARRPSNQKIRIIDGETFYSLATGDRSALQNLFSTLPKVIGDILGNEKECATIGNTFTDLYRRAY